MLYIFDKMKNIILNRKLVFRTGVQGIILVVVDGLIDIYCLVEKPGWFATQRKPSIAIFHFGVRFAAPRWVY